MRIMLTGASGMVGHALLGDVGSKEHEILAPSHGELDLTDASMVYRYLEKYRPDFVIHAAGMIGGISVNNKYPMSFFMGNLDMGRNIVYGACRAGVRYLINLSSSSIYPQNHNGVLKEDCLMRGPLDPSNEGYSMAKLAISRLCSYVNREVTGLQYKTVIPCNLYGPWDRFTDDRAHMIPAVIHRLYCASQTDVSEISVWGDGKTRREFMYVGDLADFIWMAVKRFDELPEIINVGVGMDYTMDEYYSVIADIVGYHGKFIHDLSKPSGARRRLMDVSAVHSFGWRSRVQLREGLSRTFAFYTEHIVDVGKQNNDVEE